MRKNLSATLKWSVSGLVILLSLVGCSKKENPLPDHVGGQIFQGTKIVNVNCAGCHGDLGGGGMRGPNLLNVVETLSSEEFVETVLKGRGGMPAFDAVLKEDDVLQIIDWLRNIPN